MPWGALHPPWPPPPWEIASPRARAPPGGLYKGGQGGGKPYPSVGASLPLLHLVLLPQQLGEALPEFCCIHHHAVVLLDHHQPLLPLAGSRWRRRHTDRTCVERGGVVRSALGSPVIGSRREQLLQPRSFERFRSRSTKWYVDESEYSLLDELIDGSW